MMTGRKIIQYSKGTRLSIRFNANTKFMKEVFRLYICAINTITLASFTELDHVLDGRPSVTSVMTVNSYDNPRSRYHFPDERTEVQRSQVNSPGLHREVGRGLRFDSGLSVSKAFDFNHEGEGKRYELT